MQDEPVRAGQILAGKYRVEKVLGQGMMGVVVKAHHLHLDIPVAIKIMLDGAHASAEHHRRFQREAKIATLLRSPHAVAIRDTFTLDDGTPYIVMDYLEGQDLAALLEARGPLPVPEAVGYVLQACEPVAEAHVSGVVHRDLKPANLFLAKEVGAPTIKVLDFGVSKLIDDARLTRTGSSLGSPLYMSPEQMNDSSTVDARSDVWALGAILYELIAGSPPFLAATAAELCTKVFMQPPTPLGNYRPDAPAGLAAVIEQALQKDRTRRFPNLAVFAAALAPYAPPEMAEYPERIARVESVDVEPARPTDLLPGTAPPAPRPTEPAATLGDPERVPQTPPIAQAASALGTGPTAAGPAPAPRVNVRALAVVSIAAAVVAAAFALFARPRAVDRPAPEPMVVPVAPVPAQEPSAAPQPARTVVPAEPSSAPPRPAPVTTSMPRIRPPASPVPHATHAPAAPAAPAWEGPRN